MKHFRFYPLLLLLVALNSRLSPCHAQGYEQRFAEALESRDIRLQRSILAEWETAIPGDVELYIARYNYFLQTAAASHEGPAGAAAALRCVDSALACIDEAIERYPARLDLRFGKAYFLGTVARWDDYADAIVATLDHSAAINHQWQFPNYDGDGETILAEGVQDYLVELFSQIDNPERLTAADSAMALRLRRVAKRMAQVLPSSVEALNFLAVSHTLLGDYRTALRYLRRAEAIDPTDPVIRQNISDLRERVGD